MGARLMVYIPFLNTTDIIGEIMTRGTTSITGSAIASLFFVFMVLLLVAIMFGIPFEFTALFILPFSMAVAAFYSSFLIVVGVIFFYAAYIIAKNWLFK
jgi:hypothetical protein